MKRNQLWWGRDVVALIVENDLAFDHHISSFPLLFSRCCLSFLLETTGLDRQE